MATRTAKPSILRRVFGATFYLLFLATLLVGTSLFRWIQQSPVLMAFSRQEALHIPPEEAFGGRKSINLLLLGCDKDLYYRGTQVLKQQARADMILLVRLDFENDQISAVSIPRDLRVRMPGFRTHKINAFHAIAREGLGPELTRRAVEHVLPSVEVDRVIVLDFDAFQRMIDLVGGVTIDVKKRMKYKDEAQDLYIDFFPGLQLLNGYEAMGYVRYRSDDSDFLRQERQKELLLAFKSSVVSQPLKLTRVLEEGRNVLGAELSPEELAGLMFFARRLAQHDIRMGQIPVVPGRGSFLLVNEEKLVHVLREFGFLHGADTTYSAGSASGEKS